MERPQTITPSQARQLALNLLAEHGLNDWGFSFNRAKRIMGLCRHNERRIELSVYFVLANDQQQVRDCILHEIAHALAGAYAGHGSRWKKICLRIGAKPERCGQAQMPSGSWRAVCPGCQKEYSRHRKPLSDRHYSCGKCGSMRGKLSFSVVKPTERRQTRSA